MTDPTRGTRSPSSTRKTTGNHPPDTVPARSWKITEETKKWVVCGHTPEEQGSLLKQIADAEELGKMHYFNSALSCYYEIEYGLLKGSGKGEWGNPNPY
ncbi:hypothetical protein J2741_001486 [Methanolinea mesophila]|uniref:hypothetical protein n=1 Tax=Methanolinea mesophila TaxID=547055 RepID=UPI001AE5109B|nr:hypothetical protein [Methanolinea mesophila]MBP1928939.1 hypothetical protein [Methanolinea mesophila]